MGGKLIFFCVVIFVGVFCLILVMLTILFRGELSRRGLRVEEAMRHEEMLV